MLVARCLSLSGEALEGCWFASVLKEDASANTAWVGSNAEQHWRASLKAAEDLRFEATQLDLLASESVRQVVKDLLAAHDAERARIIGTKTGEDDRSLRSAARGKVTELHSELVRRARVDLGLDLPARPRSLLGMLLAWPYQ